MNPVLSGLLYILALGIVSGFILVAVTTAAVIVFNLPDWTYIVVLGATMVLGLIVVYIASRRSRGVSNGKTN